MTTFLRMQPTCGKKKKFWAWKFNIFLVYGKCEREFSPKKFRSLQNIQTFEGEKERENVTGALIIRNINHRRYTIKGMILASCMLLHFGFTKHFLLHFCGALSSLFSLAATQYRPKLLRMWMFCMLCSTCVSPDCSCFFSLSRISCSTEHPFLSPHVRYRTNSTRCAQRDNGEKYFRWLKSQLKRNILNAEVNLHNSSFLRYAGVAVFLSFSEGSSSRKL